MSHITARTPLLDRDYGSMSLKDKNTYLHEILDRLLDSSALLDEPKYAVEMFGDYEWQPKPATNEAEFNDLIQAGNAGTIGKRQLNSFMEMISSSGDTPLYFLIHKARLALSVAHTTGKSNSSTQGLEETGGCRVKKICNYSG